MNGFWLIWWKIAETVYLQNEVHPVKMRMVCTNYERQSDQSSELNNFSWFSSEGVAFVQFQKTLKMFVPNSKKGEFRLNITKIRM